MHKEVQKRFRQAFWFENLGHLLRVLSQQHNSARFEINGLESWPTEIRCIQGHFGESWDEDTICHQVRPYHSREIWHSFHSDNENKIIRLGVLAGYTKRHQHGPNRDAVYCSIMLSTPELEQAVLDDDPLVFDDVKMLPYKYSDGCDLHVASIRVLVWQHLDVIEDERVVVENCLLEFWS